VAASRGARLNLGAEAALAFGAAVAFFLLAAAIPIRGHLVLILLLGGVYVYVVLAAASRLGPLYAVPLAIAGGLAFDSFYIPPTREFGASDWQNWLVVAIYILMGVLIGMLGARSRRRAESADQARGLLASEQAALRRVATLVAEGVTAPQLMAAVAKEAGTLLDVDGAWIEYYEGEEVVTAGQWSKPGKDPPTFDRARLEEAPVAAAVRRTGRVARIDDSEDVQPRPILARRSGKVSLVGAPISVEGAQWGLLLAWSQDSPLPADAEAHLTAFTELVATAIANSDARTKVSRLADQQASLRRVATLVAAGVAAPRLFEAVAEEAGKLLEGDGARIATYDGEDVVNSAEWSKPGHDPPTFDRVRIDQAPAAAEVRRTGRVVRFDDFERVQGATVFADQPRVTSLMGAPITVEGDQWGLMIAWSQGRVLADDAAAHLTQFTDLVATAIANAEARREVATLADEQAALRRVATLVAEGVPPPEVFAAVARELGQLLGVDSTHLARYEPDGTVIGVGSWSPHGTSAPVGTHVPLDDTSVTGLVHESGRPARLDGYGQASNEIAEIIKGLGIRSSVGAPITVDGQPWGVMVASSNRPEPLPAGTEERIVAFTDLVATAISNTEARTETHRLADEQAALRRVATLVAESVPPTELFDAVTAEVGGLLGADLASMIRYEGDDKGREMAVWAATGDPPGTGRVWPLERTSLAGTIARTGASSRVDDWDSIPGEAAAFITELGVVSSVGSPVHVEGKLWGVLLVHSTHDEPLPPDTDARVEQFTELVATAIANVEARTELSASRARIVVATDEEHRRVVRDLHDGAQQRLVHTVVTLKMASRALEHESGEASPLVAEALQHAEEANDELRELAHGILPSVLTRGGLRAGVDALASRMPVPVEIGVSVERLAPEVEATAYYVVAEALTNVAKHSHADRAAVSARVENGDLHIQVRDDGIGGAKAAGSGLVGLADRVAALDGTLRLESPPDGGTLVAADIPVLDGD
jgi:signal transduction histidine kinase